MNSRRLFLGILVLLTCVAGARAEELSAELNEQIVRIPVTVEGAPGKEEILLTATSFRPPGDGRFPLIVLSHGSPGAAARRATMGRYRALPQVREFIARGFAVLVPMRRGYGATGGAWAERFGSCAAPAYFEAGQESAKDILATLAYAATLPFVQRDRIILVGQSAGGIASLAAASFNPEGVVAVVNFSGGRAGRPKTHPGEPCVPESMTEAIGEFAKTIRVPVLWHYAENDQFFGPHHVRAWFNAFENAGARGKLVMQPPFGRDGHAIFGSRNGLPIWTAEFDRFLEEIGFTP